MTYVTRGEPATLLVEWRAYAGGPYVTVTGVSITITPIAGGAPVLAATSTGITAPAAGINAYVWSPSGSLAPGEYVVQWTGTDPDSETVGATEVVTVLAGGVDMLVAPEELATFLQLGPYASLTPAKQASLTMLVQMATAKIQRAAGGQRIVAATTVGAVIDLPAGYDDQYVALPQSPVRQITSVAVNGSAVTDYYFRSQMLWRHVGWGWETGYRGTPPQLTVTYTHGHLPGSPALQPARTWALELSRGGWGNPKGVTSEAIDDYRVTYSEADARMAIPAGVQQAIADAYGNSAYVTLSRR